MNLRCKWCARGIVRDWKPYQPRLCERCKKRGKPPKYQDALDHRVPGSFETGKRR